MKAAAVCTTLPSRIDAPTVILTAAANAQLSSCRPFLPYLKADMLALQEEFLLQLLLRGHSRAERSFA